MDSIDHLQTILAAHSSDDPIARITLAPCAWLLLNMSISESWVFYSGFDHNEIEPQVAPCRLVIAIDLQQHQAFRLWDHDGREVMYDHERCLYRYPVVSEANTSSPMLSCDSPSAVPSPDLPSC